MLRILNLGAGVQSTMLYLMSMDPSCKFHIDVAIFADTGEEPEAVYRHLDWLKSLHGPPIVVSSVGGRLGDHLSRGMNSTGQRFAPIPAFTKRTADKKEGQIRRQCTVEYKVAVVERAIRRLIFGRKPRQRMPLTPVCTQVFGLSADEIGRAGRVFGNWNLKWSRPEFPLIEREISRSQCRAWLKDRVPHRVPRSACVCCPYHNDEEWADMQAHDPAGFARAVAIDDSLRIPGNVVNRGMDQEIFLHRSCVPLKMVDFTRAAPATLDPMRQECLGMCGN